MRLFAFFTSLSLLSKAFMLVVLLVPLLHARDAYQSFEIRRSVADGLRQALVRREQVEREIMAGFPLQNMGAGELVAGLAIEVEPLHKVVTIRFLSTGIDGGGKTLVWVPVAEEKDNTRTLVKQGQVPPKIVWVCRSSLSLVKKENPWSVYTGTLNSKYAPAECRY
jgi:type IV pilus assembly protein PilA